LKISKHLYTHDSLTPSPQNFAEDTFQHRMMQGLQFAFSYIMMSLLSVYVTPAHSENLASHYFGCSMGIHYQFARSRCVCLRSANTSDFIKFILPRLQTEFGERALSHAGPGEWNNLVRNLRTIAEVSIFKKHLSGPSVYRGI
jgi:hypothetical protein